MLTLCRAIFARLSVPLNGNPRLPPKLPSVWTTSAVRAIKSDILRAQVQSRQPSPVGSHGRNVEEHSVSGLGIAHLAT